jgi:hypothetical protein
MMAFLDGGNATSATDILLQHGPWGAAVVILLAVIWRLYNRIEVLTDKRAEDIKTMSEQYRLVVEDNTKTLDVLARAYESRDGGRRQ